MFVVLFFVLSTLYPIIFFTDFVDVVGISVDVFMASGTDPGKH